MRSSLPNRRACSSAPAWPVEVESDAEQTYLVICNELTVMAEVEAAVDPDAVFRDQHIILRISRPFASSRNLFFLRVSHHEVSRGTDV